LLAYAKYKRLKKRRHQEAKVLLFTAVAADWTKVDSEIASVEVLTYVSIIFEVVFYIVQDIWPIPSSAESSVFYDGHQSFARLLPLKRKPFPVDNVDNACATARASEAHSIADLSSNVLWDRGTVIVRNDSSGLAPSRPVMFRHSAEISRKVVSPRT
jgi:hypothetical protein